MGVGDLRGRHGKFLNGEVMLDYTTDLYSFLFFNSETSFQFTLLRTFHKSYHGP